MAKTVIYRGVVYRRYKGRLYYNPSGGGISLHRQKWIDVRGDIPAGYDIHHRDENHDNNDISNFQCLPRGVHQRHHIKKRLAGRLGKQLAAWRKSKAGRRTLRDNSRKMRERTADRSFACSDCGVLVVTRHPSQRRCPACMAVYEARGYKLKACEVCGAEFRAKSNKKKEVRTCSYRCGWALRRKNAGLQPDR